jgi:predicted Zn-dependent peptidase
MLDQHTLANGMVLLGEPLEGVGSVAFDFMLPAGAATLPGGCCGGANVLADWIFRGAGTRDSRQLGDALDGLGLHRAGSVESSHVTIGAVLEAGNIERALDLYADIILEPALGDEHFEMARQLAADGVAALDDNPRQKVLLKVREQFYPEPLGRSTVGTADDIKALSPDRLRRIAAESLDPSRTIFSIAGKYDFKEIRRQMEGLFGAAEARRPQQVRAGERPRRYLHVQTGGAQVHMGLMVETVRPDDEDYYNAAVAVSVLAGGMSSRLFTEVREKRGLCYAVAGRYHGLREAAGILCYAGTTPEKAQETFEVITGQFRRLAEGITQEELQRAKVGLKSSLILQSESSGSRAYAIGGDYYLRGRVRSLDEIKAAVEETSVESITAFLRKHPFGDFTVVTIGSREVSV